MRKSATHQANMWKSAIIKCMALKQKAETKYNEQKELHKNNDDIFFSPQSHKTKKKKKKKRY